jgi:hypothetical protein
LRDVRKQNKNQEKEESFSVVSSSSKKNLFSNSILVHFFGARRVLRILA